ncbi:MAG: nucleotide exchange factor GrpE [Planctomycetota bacterium]
MAGNIDSNQMQEQAEPSDSTESTSAAAAFEAASVEVAALTKEKQELLDQLQRSRAELVNYRRRTEEERSVFERKLTADILRRVLPLFDDLSLALSSSTDPSRAAAVAADSLQTLRRGLTMISDKFDGLLREFGVEAVPAHGQRFDPGLHEALLQVESAELPADSVVAELRRGYRIGNHLLRPARVSVAKPPSNTACGDTCQ